MYKILLWLFECNQNKVIIVGIKKDNKLFQIKTLDF